MEKGDLRQRRKAIGITRFTAECQRGISAKFSSTTQSMLKFGITFCASVKAGKVWITSPIEEVLITHTFI